jgi:hypothetical protein
VRCGSCSASSADAGGVRGIASARFSGVAEGEQGDDGWDETVPRHTIAEKREVPMSEIVFLVEDAAEGGLTARALGESIFTQADSIEALREEVRDAVRCHFVESERPSVIRLHYVRDEVLAA